MPRGPFSGPGVVLQTVVTPFADVRNVRDYGAKGDVTAFGTGGTDDTGAFNAALAALPTLGGNPVGIVFIPAGIYRINGPINNIPPYVSVIGESWGASFLDYRGAADCLRISTPSGSPIASYTIFGGEFSGFSVVGAGAVAGANGIHIGDITHITFDVLAYAFSGSGSCGVLFDNQQYWTERVRGRILAEFCDTAVKFKVTATGGDNNSFDYFDLTIDVVAEAGSAGEGGSGSQNGVVLSAGAYMYGGRLRILGNYDYGSTATPAVLTITGTQPTTGNPSGMENCVLEIQAEADNSGDGSGAHIPQTINFGASSNYIKGCSGLLSFQPVGGTAMTASNVGSVGATFDFAGRVLGDSNLIPQGSWQAFTPSTQGISGETVGAARYTLNGKTVHLEYNVAGTSTQTYKTFTLPLPIASASEAFVFNSALAKDNGVNLTALGCFFAGYDSHAAGANANVCSLFKDGTATNLWTASGSWAAAGILTYETA